MLGAIPYTIYAGANWGVEVGLLGGWVLLPSGFAVGIGCGMLWGAQVSQAPQASAARSHS